MNCYNGEKYLNSAIESIYNQTYLNWEIIFWDNASKDKSSSIALSYNSKLKYFKSKKTISLGKARNKALSKCSGDYIAFLDVDDLWMPNKLEEQIKKISQDPKAVICYSDGFYIYNNIKSNQKFGEGFFSKVFEKQVFNKLIRSNFINWQTVLINKKLAIDQLIFNEKYNYAEDYDILLRLSLLGNFSLVKQQLVYYRIHSTNITNSLNFYYKEVIEIVKSFKDEIKIRNLNHDKIVSKHYFYTIIALIKQNKRNDAMKLSSELLKNKTFLSLCLYIILVFNFDLFIFKFLNFLKK